jgi:hypothetical protein
MRNKSWCLCDLHHRLIQKRDGEPESQCAALPPMSGPRWKRPRPDPIQEGHWSPYPRVLWGRAYREANTEIAGPIVTRTRRLIFIASWMVLAPLDAFSATATGLRGKSVELSWTDSRVEKRLDTGREFSNSQISTVRVYLSEQGRFFSKFSRFARRGGSLDRHAVSGEGKSVLNWRFEGNSIVADQKFASGARRIVVSFDAAVSSCSVRVVHGKESSAAIRYRGLTSGYPIQLMSIEVTSTSCSVRQGNIFN